MSEQILENADSLESLHIEDGSNVYMSAQQVKL